MNRGDIFNVSLDPISGHEQAGYRPVLVISSTEFNRIVKIPIVVPITNGGGFARARGFAVSLENTGLRTTGIVRCDQPRSLDLTARKARFAEHAPDDVVDEVLAKVGTIFE